MSGLRQRAGGGERLHGEEVGKRFVAATGEVEPSTRTIRWDGEDVEATVLSGTGLPPGTTVEGPAVVEFPETTCLVPPGWSGASDDQGILRLES